MSAPSNLKFFVERDDTGEVKRIEIQEDKQISDLLKLSKVALKFHEDAMLCLYNHEEKIISQEDYLHELVDTDARYVWIVKDRRLEDKPECKGEDKAKYKENMDNATKMNESNDEKLNKIDSVNNNHDRLREQFDKQSPISNPTEDNPLKRLEPQISSDDKSKELPLDVRNDEITMFTRKINSEGLEGFLYEIIPESYIDHNESSYSECSFSSEEKRRSIQGKVNITANWSSWQVEAGFSGWGVSVKASAAHDASTIEREERNAEGKQKTCFAVVTKTSFHQMKTFKVNVKLGEKAIEDAKHILHVPIAERQRAIIEFNNKYCGYVYSGPFNAGGWFRIVATATSNEAMEFSALTKEASEKTNTHWSAGFGGCGVNASGDRDMGSIIQTNGQQCQQNTRSSVQVDVRKESSPGNTSNEDDLEMKIRDVASCTIFPVAGAKKPHFIPIYEIVKRQAEAIGDKKLAMVSLALRLYMEGELICSIF